MKTFNRKRVVASGAVAVLFLLVTGIIVQLRTYDFSVIHFNGSTAHVAGKSIHVQGRDFIARVSKDKKDVGILTPQGWRTSFTIHEATPQTP